MRLLVTALSIASVFAYGYALAGAGMYFVKGTHTDYIFWGLLGGTVFAAAALFLYRKFPGAFFVSETPDPGELKKMDITVSDSQQSAASDQSERE
jgi:O-antigen/teichoic acid export membrane protein